MPESYLKEVQLPSMGYFYDGNIPDGLVAIEPMGTREEKLFTSGKHAGASLINKIFDSCVGLPISHKDLILGDRLFLLLQIRMVSYGDQYVYPFKCRECNASSRETLNLNDIPIRRAKEDSAESFLVTLPVLGHELDLRLLTGNDEDKVLRYAKNMKAHEGDDGATYIYRLARRLNKIDGEDCGIREAMELMDALKGMDSLHLRDEIEDRDVGPLLDVEPVCPDCGFVNGPFTMPFATEFFRPRRRRPGSADYIRTAEVIDRAV